MSLETIEVRPSPKENFVILKSGELVPVPEAWKLLPPGDAALSRRIKKDGPTWIMKKRKGNKEFSLGIWAPAARIDVLRLALELERSDPAYERKLESGRNGRAKEEKAYLEDFARATFDYLNFHPIYEKLARRLADLITSHATPVGSGTVARTKRIPIDQRAERATIAWLRHKTTAYDKLHFPHKKGARREVRRMLARESLSLLNRYREGAKIDSETCPLQLAL